MLLSLPFDIVHTLVDYTNVVDLVNLCSTCKALYVHLANDSLWKRLCVPYGLKDLAHFGPVSPFTIYTKLIHPYGPILGLWANDHPFRGNVLEFRLFAGNKSEQGGIIGEVWSCATHVDRDPIPPSYIRATKISFEPFPDEGAVDVDNSTQVRVSCYGDPSDLATRHPATIYVSSETHTTHRLEFYLQTVDLPEFPMPDAPWYDPSSRLPRLPKQPDNTLDQRLIIKIFPAARLPLIWASPSTVRKPPAMSICCLQDASGPECPYASLHAPSVPFKSLDQRPPRYYPLRRTIVPGVDPQSPDWSLQTMEGLWYGSYGLHGTEILYLTFTDDHGGQLLATKVTGDAHVPRGEVSWALSPVDESSAGVQAVRDHWTMSLHAASIVADPTVLSPARMVRGQGVTAANTRDVEVVWLTGGVIDADELQILWPHMFRTYRRYKGRDSSPSPELINIVA